MSHDSAKLNVLKERARRLSARGTDSVSRTLYERIVLVEAGRERYGLSVSRLREIAHKTPITPLPGLPHFMPGVAAVRGELVSVVDLAELRGRGRTGDSAFLAIVEVEQRIIALSFSELLQLRDVFEDELVGGLGSGDLSQAFIRAVTNDGTSLLDLEQLLRSERLIVGNIARVGAPGEKAP